ncbi:MAG: putative Ig domain-containing protein, partial [Bryobacterales bacterium]|nr:putative Ig domain-containing protein [Bryobacterales bacterium]
MTGRILALILCVSVLPAADEWPILTPKPGPSPRLNGPKVYGARPAKPFLYRIPCTGQRPITFSAKGLPKGITLDPQSGILRGTTPESKGTHMVSVEARNAHGRVRREWKLIIGDTLSLTPQMGWNSWYTHYARVTDKVMREAADIMISSGLADAGYEFVSIDDCWARRADSSNPRHRGEPRDAAGNILTNSDFPDMAGLTAYIHSKGLKTGIYTSPGPLTCGRYTGSWQHEEQDARKFAEWGFDLLKYDLCSYRRTPGANTLEEHKAPYAKMGTILQRMPRDIVLNLCQYGLADVWKWGGEIGGQSWRTTGDLGLEKDTELPGFYSIAFKNAPHWEYAGPGRWNDPDYILIGVVGDAHQWQSGKDPERVKLTANEQYSYMSLWSLMASPLFYGGDMARLDDFTLNVLTNHEVIDVNQDVLGKQARVVRKTAEELVLAKPLEDGSLAVGLFNL